MRNVLITGASGFVGRNLSVALGLHVVFPLLGPQKSSFFLGHSAQ
ncbi:MAG: hypothetical protein ACYC99_01110 [Candidatus Geothermincolia bacterium]